jgi:2-polyprenyl-3-methyl-5-hydroxy-6-metoxy-1,4-benzoquinol methylase
MTDCPCCSGSDTSVLYTKKEYPFLLTGLPDTTVICRCASCSTAFADPMPGQEELDHVYGNVFDYPEDFTGSEKRGHLKYITSIEKLTEKPGTLLDIGCASGLLLELASGKGWEPYGADISEKLIQAAQQRVPHASLFHGTVEDAGYEDGFFDAVTAVNVLEHLTDPKVFIKEVSRILKPGGVFLFKTVRIDSMLARRRKMHWDHLKWPGHLIWYSKQSLDLLLNTHDLFIQKARITGIPYIPGIRRYMHASYGSPGSLKTDTSKTKSVPMVKKIVKTVLKNRVLRACASFLNNLFRLGDTVTVYARKKS